MAMASVTKKIVQVQQNSAQTTNTPELEPISIPEIDLFDPRADLDQDSKLWNKLFNITKGSDIQFILHGFRCLGTNLVPGKGTYKLQPIIKGNWMRQDYYETMRDLYLRPRIKKLAEALKALFEQQDEELPPG